MEITEEIALLHCLPTAVVRHSNAIESCLFILCAGRGTEVLESLRNLNCLLACADSVFQ